MNDLNHFELHFKPNYFIHYQENNGSWRKEKWEELSICKGVKRLQYNTEKYQNYIIIDIDNKNLYEWEKSLPKPNMIISNKERDGGHLFYFLDRTISHKYYKMVWKEIHEYFTYASLGDEKSQGFIGKNINNTKDFNIKILEEKPYNLMELYKYVDLYRENEKPLNLPIKKSEIGIQNSLDFKGIKESVKGRNVEIFNSLRFKGYKYIKKSHSNEDFYSILWTEGTILNSEYSTPLQERELKDIVKSIYNYCVRNKKKIKSYKKRNVMNLENEISIKEKQKLGQIYTSKKRTASTELKIQKSLLEMKSKNIKINISTISKYTGLTRVTVSKYKNLFI